MWRTVFWGVLLPLSTFFVQSIRRVLFTYILYLRENDNNNIDHGQIVVTPSFRRKSDPISSFSSRKDQKHSSYSRSLISTVTTETDITIIIIITTFIFHSVNSSLSRRRIVVCALEITMIPISPNDASPTRTRLEINQIRYPRLSHLDGDNFFSESIFAVIVEFFAFTVYNASTSNIHNLRNKTERLF